MAWMNPQTRKALNIQNPVATVAPSADNVFEQIGPVTKENIDEYLGKSIAQIPQLKAEQEQHKAEQALTGAKETSALTSEIANKQRALLESPELTEAKAEQAKPFVPTKETAGDLGLLFTLTNLVGFAIGGRAKGNAQAAMSAMNGMLEGHQKGRDDLYKREKDVYDENMKQLDKRVNSLYKDIDVGVKLLATDREAGMAKINEALARDDAKFVRDMANKFGYAKMYQVLKATKEQMDKATKLRADEEYRQENLAEKIRHDKEAEAHAREMAAHAREMEALAQERLEKTGAGKFTQQQAMAQRAVNSLGGLASAVEALNELPQGTTTGMLPNLQTKDGFLNYVRNNVGRHLTKRESEEMNTLFTGIGRNLASVEASGVATGLSELSKQMQSGIYINAGTDDPYKVAIKLADIRRIATENIRPAIESGLMPPQQAEVAQKLVDRIEKAIPFTTVDVIRAGRPAGKPTIGELTQAKVMGKSYATEADAEAAAKEGKLKKGDRVTVGGVSGTWSE